MHPLVGRVAGVIVVILGFIALISSNVIAMIASAMMLLLWALYQQSQEITERDRVFMKFCSILGPIVIVVLISYWLMDRFKLWP
ncbi:MAG: hypothetical protein ACRYFY_23140 [Janthinobacterium lividum]